MAKRPPKYALHKPTGQAYVRINGKFHYLGAFDSEESHKRYDALIAEWFGGNLNADRNSLTVARLALMFVEHARQYYRKNGEETSEVYSIQAALRPMVEKFGRERVSLFGPRKLKAVREQMIALRWARTGINSAIRRIVRMLRWGVENELVDSDVYQACQAVPGLRRGRTVAREPESVKPVPMADIEAVKPFVASEVWAMIQLQLVTGMRPGEVCLMRPIDIDRAGEVWSYKPQTHKTQHLGRDRIVFLGPKAQAIIAPFLSIESGSYLFSPKAAEVIRNARRRQNRRSRLTPSQNKRTAKEDPVRSAGEHYRRDSYTKTINRACKLAEIDVWSPNRLRHNAATQFRKEFGLEAARTILGHTEADTTLFYAEVDWDTARRAIGSIG